MKRTIIVFAFFAGIVKLFAQQEVMVSQYMFNGLYLNPAYAGSHKYLSTSLTHRKQWVNFVGAPQTSLLAVDCPLLNQNMGIGLILVNDVIGVTNQTDAYLNYSYFLKLGPGKLGFGLKAGASQYTAKVGELIVWDENDPSFTGTKRTAFVPKFGFGSYYYTERWFAGISIPTLIAEDPEKDYNFTMNNAATLRKHYYLTGGYVFKLGEDFDLKPTLLIKKERASPFQMDINLMAFYLQKYALGISYRSNDAVSLMVNLQINNHFRVGYAYDATISDIKKYSSGSHEIMLGYDFGKDVIKTKTPRYF